MEKSEHCVLSPAAPWYMGTEVLCSAMCAYVGPLQWSLVTCYGESEHCVLSSAAPWYMVY
jgi:hypothetical protein